MSGQPSRSELKKNLRALKARLKNRPLDLDARMRSARTYRLLDDKKRATEHYSAVARYLSLSGHPMSAIAVLKELLQVDPEHSETLLFLAKLYARSGAARQSGSAIAAPVGGEPATGVHLALPEGLPDSATGMWRAIRAESTDVLDVVYDADEVGAVLDQTGEESIEGMPDIDSDDLNDDDETGAQLDEDESFEVIGPVTTGDLLLPRVPLFSTLGPDAFVALGSELEFHRAEPNTTIFAQGDIGKTLVILSQGKARAVRRDPEGHLFDLKTLHEGDVAGVFALLDDEGPRQASLIAADNVEYFTLDREAVRTVAQDLPEVQENLATFFRERLLLNVLTTVPLLKQLDAETREKVARDFVDRTYAMGDEVFYDGDERDGLWIVLSGGLELVSDHAGHVVDLRPGDFCGLLASDTVEGADLSARATKETQLCLLPKLALADHLGGDDARDDAKATFERAKLMLSDTVFAGNGRVGSS